MLECLRRTLRLEGLTKRCWVLEGQLVEEKTAGSELEARAASPAEEVNASFAAGV